MGRLSSSSRHLPHAILTPPFSPPRLKMGLCEGVPGSIMPNHAGRADYNGACVNQAARFMDEGRRVAVRWRICKGGSTMEDLHLGGRPPFLLTTSTLAPGLASLPECMPS